MKRQNWRSKAGRIWFILLVTVILSSLLVGSGVLAEKPSSPQALGWGDEGIKEVGVEWINDFPGTADDRSHWDESCDGLWNRLRDAGWTGVFRRTDWNTREEDFKDESRGGREDSMADAVDICMLCTHGSGAWDSFWSKNLSSVYFGTTLDDHHLSPGDAYMAYGDKDMEWLCFDACSVLSDGGPAPYFNRGYWAATMNNLHLLLGFRNTMYVVAPGDGEKWAKYMLGQKMWFPFVGWIWVLHPRKVYQAWFEAVDDVQPGGVCARVLANAHDNYNDYLWDRGYVSPDPVPDGQYWYWDHCSCTPPPLQVDKETLAQIETMPTYEVVDRQVDEEYVRQIGAAFNMTGTIGTDGEYYYMVDARGGVTYTLEVDIATGGYKYRNLSEFQVAPIDPPALPTTDEALVIGQRFFAGAGKNLPGAAYHTGSTLTMVEEQVEVRQVTLESGILQEQEISRIPTLFSLSYGRVITPTLGVHTAFGLRRQNETLSIVGPGARTKMYLGDLGEIVGAQGGSRDVETTGEVTIMDADKAWDLYLKNPAIALAQVPWVADVISRTAETLGYYEQPHGQGQKELIPAWIFTADFYAGGQLLAGGVLVYVPAAAEYLPPEVVIESPQTGAEFKAGEQVTFLGSVLQYGKPPFTYEWYSSHDGFLGTGASMTAGLSAGVIESTVISHTITLQVTDANRQQGTASIMVRVKPVVILPLLLKGR